MSEFNKWEQSEEGHKESLNFFSLPSVDTGIQDQQYVPYQPVSQIVAGGPIEFSVTPATFVDLSKSKLRLKLKLQTGSGEDVPKIENLSAKVKKDQQYTEVFDVNGEVGPVNGLSYSLFSQVDFTLSQVNTTTSLATMGYPYKNILDLLTRKPRQEDISVLFIKDTETSMNASSPFLNAPKGGNDGLTERSTYLKGGRVITLEGSLGVDMCEQKRLLLHNVPINIKMMQNHGGFYLMSPDATKGYRVVVQEATLLLCQVTLNPAVVLGVSQTLKSGKQALYPFEESVFKTFTISKGSHGAIFDGIFQGEIPENLIVAFVKSKSYSGNYGENPYLFSNEKCKFISFSYNGVSVPGRPITPSFKESVEESDFTEAYNKLYRKDPDMNISHSEYLHGNTLFYFELADKSEPDLISIAKNGHTSLEVRFDEELEEAINVLVYAKKQSLLKIDEARNVTINQ